MLPGTEAKNMTHPASDATKFWDSIILRGFVIALYLGLNISLNLLNKWTLTLYGFNLPLFMSLAHMGFSFLALLPIMLMRSFYDLHVPTLQKQWPGILAISSFFAMNIGFNNISLTLIPLSLNQVIRAGIPVVAAVGSMLIENKRPTRQSFVSLLLIVFGVGIAVWKGSSAGEASIVGIILCLFGTISNGLMMSSIGKLLSEKVDALRLTFYTAPLTCIVLLPFYFVLEDKKYWEYQAVSSSGYIGLLLLGCINAVAYNLVHSLVIGITSAVTTTVIGEMKIVLILMLSALLLGESGIWTLPMLAGCTTAILGFVMYSHASLAPEIRRSITPVVEVVPELLTPILSDAKSL